MEDQPRFIIGHHDAKRPIPVTVEAIQEAHAADYDMLTSPITTPHFHSQVLTLLSASLSQHSDENITRTKNASPVTIPPLTPADTPLTPGESIGQIIGVTSSWIDLSSPDPIIADVSRQVLKLELAYAAFCGITYALVPGPRLRGQGASESGFAQYARAILDALAQGPYMQLYIWLPMIDHSDDQTEEMGDLAPFARQQFLDQDDGEMKRLDLFGSWEAWDLIRSICKYPSRLCVALSIPKLLPPVPIQSRWYSEPVRLLSLDGKVFSKNVKGYPVLSRAHQAFISRFVRLRSAPWFLLCDVGAVPHHPTNNLNGPQSTISNASNFPSLAEAADSRPLKDPTPHLSYMRNLQTKQPVQGVLDRFGAGYQDYLQTPLQPLTVNLESITYEVFEKDPIKYAWYERAIARALHDWIEQGKPTSNPDGRVVVAVVGAGRGPLVTRALKASEDVGVEIDMWALEKNPNAFVLLQRHNETIWQHRVNLVKSDMRTWRGPIRPADEKQSDRTYNVEQDGDLATGPGATQDNTTDETHPTSARTTTTFTGSPSLDSTYLLATTTPSLTPTPYKIDILISELLGSFADNELSPECLDGVQHLMNPVHGISIPASYTAHITPIAAPKLHADIKHGMISSNPNAAEIPYVVMFNAIDYLSTTTPPESSSHQDSTVSSPTSPSLPAPYSKAHTRQQPQPQPRPQSPATPPSPVPVIGTTWSFQHPNPALPSASTSFANSNLHSEPELSNSHNARTSTLTFPIPNRGTCHGIAGYFETVLYRGVELSTNPNTMDAKSEGMISWFPIYFPLKSPVFCPDSSELTVTMWRKTDDRKVWYEWIVDVFVHLPSQSHAHPSALPSSSSSSSSSAPSTAPDTAPIGQSMGKATGKEKQKGKGMSRRVRIGGSELHSSEKEACLM
ncbi:protein arginine N-methyltransferase 5 [Capronia coronata CBS 617.96]|uniref:Protein arginine N-methyltransferase 5 n=1 Tax=Capronia coronata CBS 617.96 TaxID=1182541 RepID=W9YXH3_9EURO|nr:protein arginine N-methyltransferase 5 [Capronia coronata CBS 617.96]EXJ94355.1 protein arginine N-methyltransferase 5 [Capronia coronata CBS 617.96]